MVHLVKRGSSLGETPRQLAKGSLEAAPFYQKNDRYMVLKTEVNHKIGSFLMACLCRLRDPELR